MHFIPVLRFIIYSNLLISIVVGILACSCALNLTSPHSMGIGWTAFWAVLFVYNIQRVLRIKEIKSSLSPRHIWIRTHLSLIIFFAISGLLGSILTYFIVLGWNKDFWFLSLSFFVGVFYAARIHPKISGLRDVPYIKIYLIAIQWTLVAVFWPYMRISDRIELPILLGLSVFTFIFAATIPFDIRDLPYDSKRKKTIPQLFGVKGAKTIALLCLVLSGMFLYIKFPFALYSWAFYVCYLVLAFLILASHKDRPEMYFSGLIDGWILSYAFLLIMLSSMGN